MLQPFNWGQGGEKLTPGQVKILRELAMSKADNPTPQNLGQGIASVGDALMYVTNMNKANEAERSGFDQVQQALAEARASNDPNSFLDVMGNEWASPAQQQIAGLLYGQAQPSWQTFEVGGDRFRYNENAPTWEPEQFFDGPDQLAQSDMPSSVKEWEYYNSLPPEDQNRYLGMKRANQWLNTGNEHLAPNMANPGAPPVASVPIDNQTPAFDKALGTELGKGTGANLLSVGAAKNELDQSLAAIGNLKSPEIVAGLDAWFNQAGALPRGMWVQGGSDMAKFKVAADNVVDRSWLSARAGLKGGGPITDYESNKAENAVSMMKGALEKGDKAQYLAAVEEYEYWIKQGFAKLQSQTGAAPGGAPGGGIDDILGKYGL